MPLWGGPTVCGIPLGFRTAALLWAGPPPSRVPSPAMSFTDSTDSGSDRPVSVLWGCELSSARSSCTFQVSEDWNCEQQLVLRTACLGEAARDEFHVLEVVAEGGEGRAPLPLATLKPSVLPMASLAGVELIPPVTFRLRAGSGPLFVSGQHVSIMDLSSDEDYDDEEEEEERSSSASPQEAPQGLRCPEGQNNQEKEVGKGGGAQEQTRPPTCLPSQGTRSRPGQEKSSEKMTGIIGEFWEFHPGAWKQQQQLLVVVLFPIK
ncbi:nucleoplasmin-2 [Melospiza georgiana]|uniref:nucleoplasmin-2 n=1 Tax=Melospiza georgiana TaxID=44398 RepID=UPI0025AD0974|nr:nucleoplasmin-2 [Melospiza georgiana]